MMNRKRTEEIDIIKGLGIILMVLGHSGAPFRSFIYLFHMAIFFIASGFFFNNTKYNSFSSILQYIKSKLTKLWLPFVYWNIIYVLFHNMFITLNICTNNSEIYNYVDSNYVRISSVYTNQDKIIYILKGLWFSTNESMLAPGWFLKVLFMINIAYVLTNYVIMYLLKTYSLNIQAFISIILLAFGYYCACNSLSFKGIELMASFYCLFFIGNIFGINKNIIFKLKIRHWIPLFLLSFAILLVINPLGSIEFVMNQYTNPLFLLISSLSGWIFMFSVAYFIKFVPYIKNIMIFLGQHTLSILVLHVLCFKPIAYIVTLFYHVPSFCVSAFPNLYGQKGIWWVLYSLAGIVIPVILNSIFILLLDKIKIIKH